MSKNFNYIYLMAYSTWTKCVEDLSPSRSTEAFQEQFIMPNVFQSMFFFSSQTAIHLMGAFIAFTVTSDVKYKPNHLK